ncbi:hypothetical protein CEXT_757291 [Caerostris extrusa]|uniref:Uncharacterized protein n=1 Tax=Caerostris extrusa TaxID=172846 RepID=A0AAV4NTR7_CAEEX|nr:hypothetical protein CEXT_757291 [Caerostris extrusa]
MTTSLIEAACPELGHTIHQVNSTSMLKQPYQSNLRIEVQMCIRIQPAPSAAAGRPVATDPEIPHLIYLLLCASNERRILNSEPMSSMRNELRFRRCPCNRMSDGSRSRSHTPITSEERLITLKQGVPCT